MFFNPFLQYENSSTEYIPPIDRAAVNIDPNNTQDTSCNDVTKETMNCSFITTSNTMFTVVINATNDAGSNSSMVTFHCKLLKENLKITMTMITCAFSEC